MKRLCNGLDSIVSQAISEMKAEIGSGFTMDSLNLSELSRRTGISRSKLRSWKRNGYTFVAPGPRFGSHNQGERIIERYASMLDELLKSNVSNSVVCLERLRREGFTGGLSTVKRYIAAHKDLIPPKHKPVEGLGRRARRYSTEPGHMYQMDWGFVNVDTYSGPKLRAACFAMICHHCGEKYTEFFPNARQENLFIGMLHTFRYMGIPQVVLTDNMKSVVIRRDWAGNPIWQKDYEAFMKTVGFKTELCKPYHPYSKGKVERLVRFIKENFLPGRSFYNLNDLNEDALEWCNAQNQVLRPALGYSSEAVHTERCQCHTKPLNEDETILGYLCPIRKISYDGFVTYEGRRYGVPFSYTGSLVRVRREGRILTIFTMDMKDVLAVHNVTWEKADHYVPDQYPAVEPEEFPTEPVHVSISQKQVNKKLSDRELSFADFDFTREEQDDD